ncbi:LysM peptidoglycan-binding domain-containing protein [Bacillus halotolerans]|uniref:LysM peptidoglycan-binding domain-containing protein n=1 Tax=Bacillus halotolerans TaxID=260554 RepID=UPI00084EBFDC|nr:LysM peptidoglycan-binding domain-containing protein [Bacillus halotolerans]MEC1406274.1 LysM peptidoglycan-binding domain-containing protein [Bacillus halotolerans]
MNEGKKTKTEVKRTPRYMEIPVTDEVYCVESGDTLWTISKSFNIPVQLMNLNKLSSDRIYPGQMIKIRER